VGRGIPIRLPARQGRYPHKPQVVDGLRFASIKEAGRYCELKMYQQAGLVSGLVADKRLLRYPLVVNDTHVCVYEADFKYTDEHGFVVIEDAKGVRTPDYRIKKKLMQALYGIEVREV
jgi:hypothetical protein